MQSTEASCQSDKRLRTQFSDSAWLLVTLLNGLYMPYGSIAHLAMQLILAYIRCSY